MRACAADELVVDMLNTVEALTAHCAPDDVVLLFGTDISDAFHQVPLRGEERKYTAAMFGGKVYIFKVLGG